MYTYMYIYIYIYMCVCVCVCVCVLSISLSGEQNLTFCIIIDYHYGCNSFFGETIY